MKLPYGESNFKFIRENNYLYIDKSRYIEVLEDLDSKYLFFLRPRRFGKSLFLSMLEYYYGVQYKDIFENLFGQLYIEKNRTPKVNSYLILKFEFSRIDTKTPESTENGFLKNVKSGIRSFFTAYKTLFTEEKYAKIFEEINPVECLKMFFDVYREYEVDIPICILIDEYDHFANEILAFNFRQFGGMVSQNGFVRKFYEAIKTETGNGVVQRFFATGVTPITLDSMTSGFNIASNVSMDTALNSAQGFSEDEVVQIIKTVSLRHTNDFDVNTILPDLKKWYNGYLFSEDAKERVYNSDMILYFAKEYSKNSFKSYPEKIIDSNIASDYTKIQRLFEIEDADRNYTILSKIIKYGEVSSELTTQFNFQKEFTADDFTSLLFYMGYLSIKEADMFEKILQVPNFVIKSLFYDFFAEKIRKDSKLDVQTPDVRAIVKKLAQNNEIYDFIDLIEDTLNGLSNRDFIKFDEKYIKLLFVTYGNLAGFYYVKSEPEIHQTYPDVMFLYRPPFFPKYQFIFEIKYVKKSDDKHKIAAKLAEAQIQLKGYLQNQELQDFIYRPEGGVETLKAYSIVFAGTEAVEVVEFNY